jgi:hypothetical protein
MPLHTPDRLTSATWTKTIRPLDYENQSLARWHDGAHAGAGAGSGSGSGSSRSAALLPIVAAAVRSGARLAGTRHVVYQPLTRPARAQAFHVSAPRTRTRRLLPRTLSGRSFTAPRERLSCRRVWSWQPTSVHTTSVFTLRSMTSSLETRPRLRWSKSPIVMCSGWATPPRTLGLYCPSNVWAMPCRLSRRAAIERRPPVLVLRSCRDTTPAKLRHAEARDPHVMTPNPIPPPRLSRATRLSAICYLLSAMCHVHAVCVPVQTACQKAKGKKHLGTWTVHDTKDWLMVPLPQR